MATGSKWARKEFTTKGPDRTVVVTWAKDEISIVEFQGLYRTTRDGDTAAMGTAMDVLGEELHKALEEIHRYEEEGDQGDNADRRIYGGE